MKKFFIFLVLMNVTVSSLHSQLAVFKMVGKNSDNAKIGFGAFANWDIPLNDIGNRSVMVELLDFAYFPQKNTDIYSIISYLSIKAGYRYIFSEESKTGFFVEPAVGYCRVVNSEGAEAYGDGIAVAMETGYSLEVGQRSNTLVFGLKYERDMAGTKYTISSLAFRASYSFRLFGKRRRD